MISIVKKITYSVLTNDQTKLEIPIKQIKIKSKTVNDAKLSILQKVKHVNELITRSRVLLSN